jgi:hypothetical protein
MTDREPDDATARGLDPAAVRQLGLARGFEWTLDEAAAIRDQLASIHAGLRLGDARLDAAEEPAIVFQPGRET